MYVPTYAVAANSTHTNAQRNSCFVNELDGATEVRHDMGVPPICRIAKLYIVSKNLYLISMRIFIAICVAKLNTGIVLYYMQLVISLNEKAGLSYLTV